MTSFEIAVGPRDCALQSLQEENTRLADELMEARRTQRTLERQITKLTADLNREDSPEALQVKAILECWRTATGHLRARIPLSGDRAKLVRRMLRVYTSDELMEAIQGLALVPYVHNAKRCAYGHPKERFDDIEHCVGDEKRVENNRRLWQRAQAAAGVPQPHALWACHDHYAALAQNYLRLMLEAKCRAEIDAGDEQVLENVVRLKEIAADVGVAA